MTKSILISIKPKWVAKILNGEKTIEIRKTMPKCDLPIDVYIYCSNSKPYLAYEKHIDEYILCKNLKELGEYGNEVSPTSNMCALQEWGVATNGHILAKFTLNRIDRHHVLPTENILPFNWNVEEKLGQLCLTKEEVMSYGNGEDYYAYLWHISNLVIFDKPKELSEFYPYCKDEKCEYRKNHCSICYRIPLTKAPQSWCYVEVLS